MFRGNVTGSSGEYYHVKYEGERKAISFYIVLHCHIINVLISCASKTMTRKTYIEMISENSSRWL